MARRRMLPTILSRDLLNLALVLAFIHVDPEAYLGMNPQRSKVLDDLTALGRFSDMNHPLEISAYILTNAETNNNPLPLIMDYDDSGVSDVDSGEDNSGEDNLSSAASSPELEDAEWVQNEPPAEITNNYQGLFETDESSSIFRDLDDIIDMEFSPDEEDVENQIMHIDDRLISLDENIEHLDEELIHREVNSDLLPVENDALLTQEEENFLFQSMPEVMDPLAGWNLDPRDQEIEELIASGLPSPLMPSPFISEDENLKDVLPNTPPEEETVKQEIKEEQVEETDNQLYSTGKWI